MMMRKWVRVRVPASTSNLGPGFDVLGLALNLYNQVELNLGVTRDPVERPIAEIEIHGEGESSLPRDRSNLVYQGVTSAIVSALFRKKIKIDLSRLIVRLILRNNIPLARGLGSSAAASLGGILAGNAIIGNKLSQYETLFSAVDAEGHPDNVAPQLFGGLCVSTLTSEKIEVLRLNPPKDIISIVCIPEFELATAKARAALPKEVPFKHAVFNTSRVALLLGALTSGNYQYLKVAMDDRLHQPYRKRLVPGFDNVLESGYKAGALGIALSGAGPSIFAFASPSKAARVGRAMERGFSKVRMKSKSLVLGFNMKGAEISI